MSATKTAAPRPTTGECLICATTVPLLPGGALADHQRENTAGLGTCPGSGHTRVHGDGRDQTRRDAIDAFTKLNNQIQVKRAELIDDLTKGHRIYDVISMDAAPLAIMETSARHWRWLAIHGDWWAAAVKAIAEAAHGHLSTNQLDRAIDDLEAQGARAWLNANNMHLQLMASELGDAGKPLQDVLRVI